MNVLTVLFFMEYMYQLWSKDNNYATRERYYLQSDFIMLTWGYIYIDEFEIYIDLLKYIEDKDNNGK
jgi:hypothetical protein